MRALGTLGDVGCLSFHATKNVTCGEGGAILTNSKEVADRVEIIREKGTNRSSFLRGETDKYTWVSAGSSYVLSDILAAILQVQLQKLETITERRRQIHNKYVDELGPLESRGLLRLPTIPKDRKPNYHIFHILLRNVGERDLVQNSLRSKGIEASFHFVPLHSSPFGKQFGTASLPITTALSERLLRVPIYPDLTQQEQEHVIETLTSALKRFS
jgi:dTDP-4-amino-4,6-dideoxygalactose transaminase